jgi:hypothetical protein
MLERGVDEYAKIKIILFFNRLFCSLSKPYVIVNNNWACEKYALLSSLKGTEFNYFSIPNLFVKLCIGINPVLLVIDFALNSVLISLFDIFLLYLFIEKVLFILHVLFM